MLSPFELEALKDVGAKMAELTPEDLKKMKEEGRYREIADLE